MLVYPHAFRAGNLADDFPTSLEVYRKTNLEPVESQWRVTELESSRRFHIEGRLSPLLLRQSRHLIG